MSGKECNYQSKVTTVELLIGMSDAACKHCGASAEELIVKGELLEICGEEYLSDIVTGERLLVTIALCPKCHQKNHLNAHGRHNPCQIKARFSRESCF